MSNGIFAPKLILPKKTTPLRIIGLDPSLTGTGLVVISADGFVLAHETVSTDSATPTDDRLAFIVARSIALVDGWQPSLAVIERPALSHVNRGSAALIGLHYLLRAGLNRSPHLTSAVQVVAPNTWKKYVTGKGNAGKEQVAVKTFKRWGIEFANQNLCDAHGLAQWGRAFLRGEVEEPKAAKKKGRRS